MSLFNWRSDPVKKEFLVFHKRSKHILRVNAREFLGIIKSKDETHIKLLHLRNLLVKFGDLESLINEAIKKFKNKSVDMHVFIKLRHEFDAVNNKINEEIKKLERN